MMGTLNRPINTTNEGTTMTCTCCGSTVIGNRVVEANGTEFVLGDES